MSAEAWTLESALPPIDISIELFPPKHAAAAMELAETLKPLAALGPRFFTVTSGAGGSEVDTTAIVVDGIREQTGLAVAAHITCVGRSRDDIGVVADRYWNDNIRHLVALRGDPPQGVEGGYAPAADGYAYAVDLIAGLKRQHDFEISAACYPETHPEAGSPEKDLDNLKRKVDAGACRLIGQYCFDTDQILRFRDRMAASGITVPFVPGVMPIRNFKQIKRFSGRCGASIPAWLESLFDSVESDSELHNIVAASVASEQCRRLIAEGFGHLHIYALNRAELATAIGRLVGSLGERRLAA